MAQTVADLLRLVLLRLRPLGLDGNVAHRCGPGCAVPVVLARRNQNHVTRANGALLLIGGHHPGALGDDQDLITGVLVELVARTGAEVDDAEVEALTLGGIDDHLSEDLSREEWTDGGFLGQIADLDDLHRAILNHSPEGTRSVRGGVESYRFPRRDPFDR